MANYNTLKNVVTAAIKTNGNKEITGQMLQDVLIDMINSLGKYNTFVGIATPATSPGTPDENVFYVAREPGLYANFGGLSVDDGEIAFFVWSGSWTKQFITVVGGGGGGGSITVDDKLSETSENPVQNKVITAKFKEYYTISETDNAINAAVVQTINADY